MARLWELPGWNTGAKVRRKCWSADRTAYFLTGTAIDINVFDHDDWELFQEPERKPVVLKRYTYQDEDGYAWKGEWRSTVPKIKNIVGIETKEVPVDD